MKKRIPSPFLEPTNKAWRRSRIETYRQDRKLYISILFLLIIPALFYYIFSWSISIEERNALRMNNFYMVSYADIYPAIESFSEKWSDDAEMTEVWFDVYPYINDGRSTSAFFKFWSPNKGEELTLYAYYQNEKYTLYPSYYVVGSGTEIIVYLGNATPLPEEYGYQDSLIAFETLYPSLENTITENYINIRWPLRLYYWPDAGGGEWELTYTFEEFW